MGGGQRSDPRMQLVLPAPDPLESGGTMTNHMKGVVPGTQAEAPKT